MTSIALLLLFSLSCYSHLEMSNNEVGEVKQEKEDEVEVETEEDGEDQKPPQVRQFTEEQMERLVRCRTSEGEIVEAPWHLMAQSKNFMHMWEELGMENAFCQSSSLTATEFEFPLEEITGECFQKILEWMREHHNVPDPILREDPVTKERIWFKFTDWEKQFFDVDFEDSKEYFLAANFLDIPSLYHYCAQEGARCIMGKSGEQIREMLCLEDNLTDEEKTNFANEFDIVGPSSSSS
uniref:SKP1 component dimerisation domain-containing protein n=1 Tax=Globodera rostochiensis TaxID=31243 RepID=A0A914HZJ3_GLORO